MLPLSKFCRAATLAPILLASVGCNSVLGIEDPVAREQTDAAVDQAADQAVDAASGTDAGQEGSADAPTEDVIEDVAIDSPTEDVVEDVAIDSPTKDVIEDVAIDSPTEDVIEDAGGEAAMCGPECPVECVQNQCVTVSQIVALDQLTCAVLSNHTARCFGLGADGQLGDGTGNGSATPRVVMDGTSPLANVEAIGAGPMSQHVCARLADGHLRCWGNDSYGALGNGISGDEWDASKGPASFPWTDVTVGGDFTCGVKDAGLWCWGHGNAGQLGFALDGSTSVTEPMSAGFGDVSSVRSGYNHSCVRRTDGSAWCWGNNDNGRLGNQSTAASPTPVQVKLCNGSALGGVESVSVGGGHACAVLANKTVVCWGRGGSGELGDNLAQDSHCATAVAGLNGARSVSCGTNSACAVTDTGALLCWGDNGSGELGDGTKVQRNSPVLAKTPSAVEQVSCGLMHTCARHQDGSATCWGFNSFGQLGDGTVSTRPLPKPVIWK